MRSIFGISALVYPHLFATSWPILHMSVECQAKLFKTAIRAPIFDFTIQKIWGSQGYKVAKVQECQIRTEDNISFISTEYTVYRTGTYSYITNKQNPIYRGSWCLERSQSNICDCSIFNIGKMTHLNQFAPISLLTVSIVNYTIQYCYWYD